MIKLNIKAFSYEQSDKLDLKNIQLGIKPGSCTVLTGKSGCGKSTLLRLMNRLIPNFYNGKFVGDVIIDGKSIHEYGIDDFVLKVGCVFQNPSSQFFNVDTESEIAFGCENLGLNREEIHRRVEATVETLGIQHLMERSIFSLSGGEKQMIAIASVYAMGVDIILMDEPSANLDKKATKQLEKIIGIMKKQGKTIVIAEHRLHYLKSLADKLVILRDGEIVNELTHEIQTITTDELHAMGLRALDIDEVITRNHAVDKGYIEINNLSVAYKKGKNIIENLSENFDVGVINGIVGHNGRGKSTFAKCLCGMIKENGGSIHINGEKYITKRRLGHVYMVLQNTTSQLFSDSVLGELELAERTSQMGSDYHHEDILKLLELFHLKHRHPMSLSGGEKQRLALAVGMIQNAEIMMLDEPTSGLDYASMLSVKKTLEKLKEENKCIIVITHDDEFLNTVCDNVIQL